MSMEQENERIVWIRTAPYIELLKVWRFAPSGDLRLSGKCGTIFQEEMNLKSNLLTATQRVSISKSVGW